MLPLTLPSLVSLEWTLGMTIASSSASSSASTTASSTPARPFVVLSFVIDDNGRSAGGGAATGAASALRRETVELSLPQYLTLSRSLREMAQQMDAM